VIFRCGHSSPLLAIAALIRSRASRSAVSAASRPWHYPPRRSRRQGHLGQPVTNAAGQHDGAAATPREQHHAQRPQRLTGGQHGACRDCSR
jgi:hypothetical protein